MDAPHDHTALMNSVGNLVSAGTIMGTLAGALPPLAAAVAVLWYLIQIWESQTVQKSLHRRRRRHLRRRRAKAVANSASFIP